MKAYLDTVLISALAKNDQKVTEQNTLIEINAAYLIGSIELVTSVEVEDELNKIPDQYRNDHLAIFKLFSDVPRLKIGGITRLGPMGIATANPKRRLWNNLSSILPDTNDAMHIFITATNRIEWFLTVDESTILKHKKAVENISGVKTLLPSDFVKLLKNQNAT